ncbi:MAG: hypothetical protein ACK4M9_08510 [Anaerobacillus sp.]|uniref:hypothetical protein n=1 Tax=Anaerobacillus sp. TaxID=1872506 RepID=UPI0039192B80
MFIGSWKINVIISFTGFSLVFIGSFSMNGLPTSLLRACLAFLFFYIVSYFVRWLWALASKDNALKTKEKLDIEESEQGEARKEEQYSEADIEKTSQYVKDLINN